jgi:hypothetical protein
VYRGHPPPGCASAGVDLLSLGGPSAVTGLEAHEMGAAWIKVGSGVGQQRLLPGNPSA